MRLRRLPFALLTALPMAVPLSAWSPAQHEAQTLKATRLAPARVSAFLKAYREDLLRGARGQANDQPPSAEEVYAQYYEVIKASQEGRRPEDIAYALGRLAHLVQALHDPSETEGISPLRESFEAYADEHLAHLVVTREAFWALRADPDPTARIRAWMEVKQDRNRKLLAHFDFNKGKRIGPWDELSVPFAQLQLAFSGGIHATANLWILAFRAVGENWKLP